MEIGSAFSHGVQGLAAAESLVNRAAERTLAATIPTDRVSLGSSDGLVDATVDRMRGELAFKASVKVIQSADRMSEDLLGLLIR